MSAPDALLGRQDLHCHTTLSDGTVEPEEVARLAAERGVEVGIADHVSSRNPRMFVADAAELRRYFAAIEPLPVWLSGEFCWCDGLWSELPAELLERFDYRIGSNHGFHLPDGTFASPWWEALPEPWDRDPQGVMEGMVDALCAMVRSMPVQVAAHSTLTPPALLELEGEPEAWWTEPREERYVAALVESGVALEISNRYRLPHDRLLRRARAAGVRFSLGSDGHHREQVARLEWAAETARRVGIGDADLFVPERRRRA